jgi:hypothetical protein
MRESAIGAQVFGRQELPGDASVRAANRGMQRAGMGRCPGGEDGRAPLVRRVNSRLSEKALACDWLEAGRALEALQARLVTIGG